MRKLVKMRNLMMVWLLLLSGGILAQPVPKKKISPKIKYPENKEFKVDSVVLRRFYPGVMGAPIVFKVDFYCKAKRNLGSKVKSDFLTVDSIWMDDKRAKAHLSLEKIANPLAKGREFQIVAELVYPTSNRDFPDQLVEIQTNVPPKKYKGKMLLRYYVAGKAYFVDVPDFQYGTTIYAP